MAEKQVPDGKTKGAYLGKAERMIERNSEEWLDYCSNLGVLPDNVKHVTMFVKGFAMTLMEEDGVI